jgi:poly(3-hydroxybutyrate) depolymerase
MSSRPSASNGVAMAVTTAPNRPARLAAVTMVAALSRIES